MNRGLLRKNPIGLEWVLPTIHIYHMAMTPSEQQRLGFGHLVVLASA